MPRPCENHFSILGFGDIIKSEKGIDKMENNRRLSPLAALVIIIGIACATFIGYKIAQNNRYTPMDIGNFSILWDNWKNEPVLEPNSEASRCYILLYGERIRKNETNEER